MLILKMRSLKKNTLYVEQENNVLSEVGDEYYLNPPSKQTFYKMMAFLLTTVALNTEFWSFYKTPKNFMLRLNRLILSFIVPVAVLSQTVYLIMNYSQLEFNTLAMVYTVIPVTFILLIKHTVSKTASYKKAMVYFIDLIHVSNYYSTNKEPHVKEILIKAEKYTRLSFYIMAFFFFVCTNAFLMLTMVHSYQNNDSIYNITTRLEILVHFWMPFDYEYNFFYWAIMQVVTVYCVFLTVYVIVLFDVVNLAFLYQFIGHIKILQHVLRNDFKREMTEEETKYKLVEVTRYYSFIKKILKVIEDAFGLNIIGIYLHNLLGGGILMYQMMNSGTDVGTILSYGLMIPIYMGELIIMSLVMENIRIQADEIPELVYNLRWNKMSIRNQNLVLMILFQVQPVLQFRAAFNVKTGMNPAMNIIKTAFSYYVMIKSRI